MLFSSVPTFIHGTFQQHQRLFIHRGRWLVPKFNGLGVQVYYIWAACKTCNNDLSCEEMSMKGSQRNPIPKMESESSLSFLWRFCAVQLLLLHLRPLPICTYFIATFKQPLFTPNKKRILHLSWLIVAIKNVFCFIDLWCQKGWATFNKQKRQ